MHAWHVPLLSLAHPDEPALIAQIDQACRTHGFLQVCDHGVAPDVMAAVQRASRAFFALPEATKQRWHIQLSGHLHRGYDPIGWQALEAGRPADLKESFYLGIERGADDPLVQAGVPGYGANPWPDEALLPGFRAACEAYTLAMSALSRRLMGLIAQALGLPAHHFDDGMRHPAPVLRLLHYPPQQASQLDRQIGSGAHTDWGALTLLWQDDAGGLQVQAPDGQWLDVPPEPGAFVVNLGDLMQRWTHDRYRSNLHRVINARSGRDRYSIAWFWEVDHDAQIATLPTCLPADGSPSRYPPITAGEHIQAMYRRTTLA